MYSVYIYIRFSKRIVEHVYDLNFQRVLDKLQQGKQYRMASNGWQEFPVNNLVTRACIHKDF